MLQTRPNPAHRQHQDLFGSKKNAPEDCAHDPPAVRHHGESKIPAGAGRRRFRGA